MNGRAALGLLLVGGGVLGLLGATGVLELSYGTWVGIVLIGIGLALALIPGRHVVLMVLGVLVALTGLPALLVDDDLYRGGVGDALERPETRAELEPFRQAIGKLVVDLTDDGLDLDEQTIIASLGVGELVVLVPEDADVTLDAHVGVGKADALGQTDNGVDVDLTGISGTSGREELTLELEVGIGNLRVSERP